MRKATYFDVEYANRTNKSICQMGIVCENARNGEPCYPDKDIFINPEDIFEKSCTALHGIDARRVKNAPTFPAAWSGLEKYFASAVIIGYETANDLDALTYALNRYKLDVPALYYLDTKELAQLYIPAGETSDFTLTGLCNYFGIKLLTEHYAYDDAMANADLFKKMVKTFNINAEQHIKKFEPAQDLMAVSIGRFYGMVQSFVMDEVVTDREVSYITKWYDAHKQYAEHKQIAAILTLIEGILSDGTVTAAEIKQLEKALKNALGHMSSNQMTASTQILSGILEGLAADGNICIDECHKLHTWLIGNAVLTGNFAYDKLMSLVDNALADGTVSAEDSDEIIAVIKQLV